MQRRGQIGLLAQPIALADAPLELQALLREFLQVCSMFRWSVTKFSRLLSATAPSLTGIPQTVTPSSRSIILSLVWQC